MWIRLLSRVEFKIRNKIGTKTPWGTGAPWGDFDAVNGGPPALKLMRIEARCRQPLQQVHTEVRWKILLIVAGRRTIARDIVHSANEARFQR